MKRFRCPSCALRVFYEDEQCTRCGTQLYYSWEHDRYELNAPACLARGTGVGCNWAAEQPGYLCTACVVVERGASIGPEVARPYYSAIRRALRQLALAGALTDNPLPSVRFRIPDGETEPVIIGHSNGVITLDAKESDPSVREALRTQLHERYRTVLGHVRHELGHWHWQTFILPDLQRYMRFHELFGDESEDYQAALERHYAIDPRQSDGQGQFLSHYASAHPWEDYAETFAHALHIHDTVETCVAADFIPARGSNAEELLAIWDQVATSMNELNRSMGTDDPYPFAVPGGAIPKLTWLLTLMWPWERW
ncbi:MAG: putative zinc-binding metallopeptidase [Actinobacteria bacterium]|nr:putative zinc-binding metallopeptidase [Actinomycetota bacterium]